MECGLIRIGNMNLEKERYQTIGGFRYVDMAKDGESHSVAWMELKTNEEILQKVEEKDHLQK